MCRMLRRRACVLDTQSSAAIASRLSNATMAENGWSSTDWLEVQRYFRPGCPSPKARSCLHLIRVYSFKLVQLTKRTTVRSPSVETSRRGSCASVGMG